MDLNACWQLGYARAALLALWQVPRLHATAGLDDGSDVHTHWFVRHRDGDGEKIFLLKRSKKDQVRQVIFVSPSS